MTEPKISRRCHAHGTNNCEREECVAVTSETGERRGPTPTPGAPEVSWLQTGYAHLHPRPRPVEPVTPPRIHPVIELPEQRRVRPPSKAEIEAAFGPSTPPRMLSRGFNSSPDRPTE